MLLICNCKNKEPQDFSVIQNQFMNLNFKLKVVELPDDVYPTDMHWFPKGLGGGKKAAGSDVFALCSTDGEFTVIVKPFPYTRSYALTNTQNTLLYLIVLFKMSTTHSLNCI